MTRAHRPSRSLALLSSMSLAACIAAVTLLGQLSVAHAEDASPTWSVQPGSATGPDGRSAVEATVDAGAIIQDTVVVTNHSDFPVTYGLYAVDAKNESQDGSFSLVGSPEENVDMGTWITFAANASQSVCNEVPQPAGCPVLPAGATALTLGAGETAQIPVTINVPHNAISGDHAAGLVAAWYNNSTSSDGQPLTLEQRVGTRVYVRVNGELKYDAAVNGLTGGFTQNWNPFTGDATVRYHLENVGNVRLHVDQVIVLTGPFGIELGRSAPVRAEHLNPGQRIAVDHTFAGVPTLLGLTATAYAVAVGTDGVETPALEASTTIAALPWLLLLLIAAAAAIVWFVRYRRRQHEDRLAATIAEAQAAALAHARNTQERELIGAARPESYRRNGGGEQ